MNFQQLRYFVTTAQLLNFTAAAEYYYITQPTICRQISALEEEIGAALFDRSTHGIRLTDAGKDFVNYAIDTLDRNEHALLRVQNIAKGKLGTIRISCLPSSKALLTKCIAEFSKRYPDVHIDIDLPTGIGQIEAMNKENGDFFFAYTSMAEKNKDLEYIEAYEDRFCLTVPKNYEDEIKTEDFSSLTKLPFVIISPMMGPVFYERIMQICKARNYEPNIHNYYNHAAACLISVNAGAGISILPETLLIDSTAENVASFPIPGEDAKISYSVAWVKENPNPAAKKFLEVVRELFS